MMFCYLLYTDQIEKKFDEKYENIIVLITCCLIYNFTYINLKNGKSGKYQIIFYLINFVKLALLSAIYYIYHDLEISKNLIFFLLLCYICGCILICIFYYKLHPKNDNNNLLEAETEFMITELDDVDSKKSERKWFIWF